MDIKLAYQGKFMPFIKEDLPLSFNLEKLLAPSDSKTFSFEKFFTIFSIFTQLNF